MTGDERRVLQLVLRERGLLLVMRRGRNLGLASPRRREADVFRTTARVRGARPTTFRLDGFPYAVAVEG